MLCTDERKGHSRLRIAKCTSLILLVIATKDLGKSLILLK